MNYFDIKKVLLIFITSMNNKKGKKYINEKKAKFENKSVINEENKQQHKPNLQKSKHKSKHKYKHYHKQKILINNENDNRNNYESEFHNVNDIDEKVGLGSSNNKFRKQNQCIHEHETHNETNNILNNIFKNPFEYNPFVRQTNRLNIFIQLSNGYRIQRRLGIFQQLSENEN